MKTNKQKIEDFLNSKKIALAGVSRNKKKFGYISFKSLIEKGYNILPINPDANEIDGKKCFKSITDLPSDVESVIIMTPKDNTDEVLIEAINKGIKNIWVQQMSDTKNTIGIAEEYQKEIVTGKCIFMFAEPITGVHKFHRTLVKIFGGLPR
jgi:predicted CoA-binding protein